MLGCMEWPHFASARLFMPPKWHDWPPGEPETSTFGDWNHQVSGAQCTGGIIVCVHGMAKCVQALCGDICDQRKIIHVLLRYVLMKIPEHWYTLGIMISRTLILSGTQDQKVIFLPLQVIPEAAQFGQPDLGPRDGRVQHGAVKNIFPAFSAVC